MNVMKKDFHGEKVLILVSENNLTYIKNNISLRAAFGWENHISVKALKEKSQFSRHDMVDYIRTKTEEISLLIQNEKIKKIISYAYLALDFDAIAEHEDNIRIVKTPKTLLSCAEEQLKILNLDWLTCAEAEWNKSSLKKHTPQKVWPSETC